MKHPLFPKRWMTTKIEWPSDEVLAEMVRTTPVTTVAKKLGVSGTAIAKRCKRRGIALHGQGYWSKIFQRRQTGEPADC